MFDALVAEIDTLEIPLERDAIVAVVALHDRLGAHISATVGEYQAIGGHEVDGSITMASWLRHHAGMDPTTATKTACRAAKLRRLPVLRRAEITGLLTRGAVDTILAKVPNRHLGRFAEHEADLVPVLAGLDLDGVTVAMREWRARADALDPGPAPVELPDTLHLAPTLEDRGALNGTFGTDLFNLTATALRVADCGDPSMPLAQRRAIAWGQVCQSFLDHNPAARHRRHRPHLTITMTYQQWADHHLTGTATYLDTGMPVTPTARDVLRCDAAWHRLTHDHGAVLHYGRATRHWSTELANAIATRDGGCRWPGCTAPVHWCDVHHVHYWEHGGPTDIDNGLLLCRRHHRMLHTKAGWELKLLPDGTAELTHPDGTTEQSYPKGLHPPRLPRPDA